MTKTEQFEHKQAEMSNEELIALAGKEVSELARTYGKSHRMTIPPMITDTDMILGELIRRFKDCTSPVLTNKRRSGNTTRLIDMYIQKLFSGEKVVVIRDHYVCTNNRPHERKIDKLVLRKLLGRLNKEHYLSQDKFIITDGDQLTIQFKPEGEK